VDPLVDEVNQEIVVRMVYPVDQAQVDFLDKMANQVHLVLQVCS
jgi:hypothetical protein